MKQETKLKKMVAEFRIEDLLGIGFTIIVLAIGLAYGLNVMGDVRDDMTADTAEYNATLQGITAVGKIPAKLGLIVTVVIAAVIIGILVTYLWIRFK
jgi:hypothetical protein|tara:strand:- start:395 stop:685 length:291 start_codon:yes stop_codon:yes gene_type:complete